MRIKLMLAALPLLLILLTWLLLRGMDPEAELFDDALAALDRLAAGENALQRDMLKARTGLLRNYDPLVRDAKALGEALDQLTRLVATDPTTMSVVDRLSSSLSWQEELVERFKSENSLLQNLLAYFRLFSDQVMKSSQDGATVRATGALASAILNLSLDTSSAAAREVADDLDKLASQLSSPDNSGAVEALLAYGRLLHDVLPETDTILKALLEGPNKLELAAARGTILTYQSASRERARYFRLFLYGTSLLLLGLLVYLGLELRMRAVRLRRRATLEHLLAAISTRFVNAASIEISALIEEALADLARHVGAHRAYFITESRMDGAHTWRYGGEPWPADWPHQVLALIAYFKANSAGIIYVRKADRLPPGFTRDTLGDAGVHDWACVPAACEDTVRSVLGFDVLRAGFAASSDELGLLRMARDAIASAIRRNSVEQARRDLENRLHQARRMETVGALASGIAHNFNNIIGAIIGHAEMAEAQIRSNNSPAARNLDAIRQASERARDLVDQILVFGRRQEGRQRPVNVSALIAEAGFLLRASLPDTVVLVVPPVQQPIIVSGEPAQLQQVIINLCNNAAQAMNNSGCIEVATDIQDVASSRSLSHGELAHGQYVCLTVSDTGRGMDAATFRRIFEPFFTTRQEGNGLGLATVRDIVEDHGGAINVESAPGLGSRFEIWLPSIQAAAEPRARGIPLGNGETLLVVGDDDERLLRDEEILAALGYEPIGFRNATDALAAYKLTPERFDAVVVILRGHAAAALEFAAAVHATSAHSPIVFAACSVDEIGAGQLAAAGVSELIHQPINSAEVAAALTRCLAIQFPIQSA
jgi:signal transduction histidine kinase